MSAKRIAYIVPQFPGQTHGFFWREVMELEAHGVEPSLFSTTLPHNRLISHGWSKQAIQRTTYLATYRLSAILGALFRLPYRILLDELISMSAVDRLNFLQDVAICAPAALRLEQSCNQLGIKHVHVHSCGRAALVAALAHQMCGLSYSLTLHGDPGDYGVGQKFKWRNAKFVSVVSEALLPFLPELLGDALPARVPVRPMGVDTASFRRDSPYQPMAEGETLRLFCCGRLNIGKGYQDLLTALRILLDEGRTVTLEIAGEDDSGGSGYRQVLEKLVVELGLSNCVKLLGAVSSEEVRAGLMRAHAFVLASWYEGVPVAYMEAMSCEVPIIATETGGVPELITDGVHGVLVPVKDPEALARAVSNLADDPERAMRIAKAGRERVTSQFDSRLGAEMLIKEIWGQTAEEASPAKK